jgi:Na+/H+-translocating membrane pyrophosphatase
MLFVGGMIPVVSRLAMNSVGKQLWIWCMKYVVSLRNSRNYGRGKPEYAKCVDISQAALREMMLPGILTIGLILIVNRIVYTDNNQ